MTSLHRGPDPDDVAPLVAEGGPFHDAAATLAENWTDHPKDRSLRLDWAEIRAFDRNLADNVLDHPDRTFKCIQQALKNNHRTLIQHATVRVRNLPDDHTHRVGDLRERHLRTLIAVQGEVVKVEPVKPLLTEAAFECQRCGTVTYMPQDYGDIRDPAECMACEEKGPFSLLEEKSELIDFQPVIITPQESALDDPPALPVYLRHDIVNTVGEEDEVTVVGVYKTMPLSRQRETELNVFLEAVDIDVDEYAEADAVTTSRLSSLIYDAIAAIDAEGPASYGVDKAAVVDRVADEHGVRRKEIEDRIEALDEDESADVTLVAGQILPDG